MITHWWRRACQKTSLNKNNELEIEKLILSYLSEVDFESHKEVNAMEEDDEWEEEDWDDEEWEEEE